MTGKMKKILISLLCVTVALCTGLIGTVQVFAESQQDVYYLSDVKLYYSDSGSSDAKKKCENDGYIFVNNDLNKGTAQNYVYIGYKTTTNRDMAITDIRMLGMGRDYYLYNYNQIIDYLKKTNEGTAQTMYEAANVFAENYKAGSPKAKDAYEGLNLFYVGNENTKFGDYIISGKADIDFFTQMIVKSSAGTLSAVMVFLNSGIASYKNEQQVNEQNEKLIHDMAVITGKDIPEETTAAAALETDTEMAVEAPGETAAETAGTTAVNADDTTTAAGETAEEITAELTTAAAAETADGQDTLNWAETLADNPLWDIINNSDITTAERNELHRIYNDDARAVFTKIQEFTTLYENAKERNPGYSEGNLARNVNIDKDSTAKETVEEMDNLEIEDGDALYLAAFEALNQYKVNDNTYLGDWVIDMGLQTSDEVDIMQLYPMIDTLGEEQAGLIGLVGFLGAASNTGENQRSEEMAETIDDVKAVIKDYNKKECISIFEASEDGIENAHLAYTSDAVRKSSANNSIGRKTNAEILEEKMNEVIEMINLISCIAFVAVYVVQMGFMFASMALAATAACATATAVCTSIAAGASAVCSFLGWFGLAIMITTIKMMIANWIAEQIGKLFPATQHTTFPDYVFDAADTKDGVITVKYKSVRDQNGKVGDLNGYKQPAWALLACTVDSAVGSPIRADDAGNIFKVVYGNSAMQKGYDCVNFFGERNPANANYKTGYDTVSGIYISYVTEQSLSENGTHSAPADDNGETSQTTEEVKADNYIADIVVVTAGNASSAKAKISKKKGKYYTIDYNLSPGAPQATYIGYSMTTNKDDALTDIRVAPYHGNDALMFGDVQYTFVGHMGIDVGDDSSNTAGDALMKTTDPKAGSPIPADGIHMVTNHKDAEPGWEPVTVFSGMPYNFNTNYERLDDENSAGSGYYTTNSGRWDRQGVYMYYEPSIKYTGGEKYLSSIYFCNGYKVEKTFYMMWSQTTGNVNQLQDRLKEYPYMTMMEENIAASVDFDDDDLGHSNLRQYICYAYTYNPKRAISDIVVFQGDTYSDSLPYTITKKNAATKSVINYAACTAVCQQAPNMSSISEMKITRFISPDNAVYNSRCLMDSHSDYDHITGGYTYELAPGFKYGYNKANFLPFGLYVTCNTTGKEPLKLSDVIITRLRHPGIEKNGRISFEVDGEKTLAGTTCSGAFHSVYDIKDPNSLDPINISYPDWYSSGNKKRDGRPMFIYIRNAKESKRKYISSVSVGSFSRDIFKKSLGTADQNAKNSAKDSDIDKSANLTAMVGAAGGCTDEMICFNIGCNQSDAWYKRQKGGKAYGIAPADTAASYIGVSRTDNQSEAIRAILLYQNDDFPTANKIVIDKADYYCDSTNMPIVMNGKQYYLYYTRNRGVLSGSPIEEITVNNEPISTGSYSALFAKAGEKTTYGEQDLSYYIHLHAAPVSGGTYYTELFLGSGVTRNAALGNLVSQECSQYIDMDLNYMSYGNSVYLGYNMGVIEPDATEEDIEDAMYEAIYDIIITKGEPYHPDGFINEKNNIYYVPVADVNLNDPGPHVGYFVGDPDELYMYYCSPYTSARFNRAQSKAKTGIVTALPEEVFSAPLSKLAFALYDRVPYNSSLPGTSSTGDEIMRWEYVMLSDHSAPADLTAGTGVFSGDSFVDNRVTMFAQRLDGSVKPAGEITGGFVAEQMKVGTLTVN